jgi:manganese/zinc/iron transport system ATP- binding protein
MVRPGIITVDRSRGAGAIYIPDSSHPLSADRVTVELGGTTVLRDVSFSLPPGRLTALVGPNGAGKSTLMNAIIGHAPLAAGSIRLFGQPLERVRGLVAYVPQRDRINWRFPVTAAEVVLMGRCRSIGLLRRPGRQDKQVARECLERTGMADAWSSPMEELSGGQRQRVFMARALAQEPELFLLDESLSAIDFGAQEALFAILKEVAAEGKTVLLATHDLAGVAKRCDVCLCLNCHVCAYGPPDQVITPDVVSELYAVHDPALLSRVAAWSR